MVVVVVVVYPKVRDNNWGDIPVDVPSPTKILGGCVPGIAGGVDASAGDEARVSRLHQCEADVPVAVAG